MRKYGNWKIAFFNPGKRPEGENLFGCATLGAIDACGIHAPDEDGLFVWKELCTDVVCGSADECIADLKALDYAPESVLMFLSKGLGAEAFIARFHDVFPLCGIAGGVSASLPGVQGELLPLNGDAVILLLKSGAYRPCAQNVLSDTGRRFKLKLGEQPRRIETIMQGPEEMDALPFWRNLQREYALPEDNFECLTLSNANGVNIHMNGNDGVLSAGADCSENSHYMLRYASHEEIDARVQDFVMRKDALICGCAGLKAAMRQLPKVPEGTLELFLYGEIACGEFGNLMMTALAAH